MMLLFLHKHKISSQKFENYTKNNVNIFVKNM